jgi:hypothetical protein
MWPATLVGVGGAVLLAGPELPVTVAWTRPRPFAA